jgi:DNA-binding response OmpR family regulator
VNRVNQAVENSNGQPAPHAKGGDVLIVDDNQIITKALAALLAGAGYGTAVFHNGAGAIGYADRNTPCAAVLDIHLPDISGLVLATKLRQRFGEMLPIIVVSGDTSMETLGSLSHVGATYFFSKPVNGEHLVERLKEWMAVT